MNEKCVCRGETQYVHAERSVDRGESIRRREHHNLSTELEGHLLPRGNTSGNFIKCRVVLVLFPSEYPAAHSSHGCGHSEKRQRAVAQRIGGRRGIVLIVRMAEVEVRPSASSRQSVPTFVLVESDLCVSSRQSFMGIPHNYSRHSTPTALSCQYSFSCFPEPPPPAAFLPITRPLPRITRSFRPHRALLLSLLSRFPRNGGTPFVRGWKGRSEA